MAKRGIAYPSADGAPRDGGNETRQIHDLQDRQRGRVEDGYAGAAGRGLVKMRNHGERGDLDKRCCE